MKLPRNNKRGALPVVSVVVGAGEGKRFAAGVPKAFARFSNGEILLHAVLRRLAASSKIKWQVVVAPEGNQEEINHWADIKALRLLEVVSGGAHRSESVRNGLESVQRRLGRKDAIVLIHDAARPCVSIQMIDRIVDGVIRHGNATPTIAISDTVKEYKGIRLRKTLDRGSLCAIQTPQGFVLSRHLRMLRLHPGPHLDDTIPWSKEGKSIFRVEGDRRNMKVTYPEDLGIIESLLEEIDGEKDACAPKGMR